MADISLTTGMRANLLQLKMTETLMDRTQQRISTGKKINSALDGPAAYFAAKALTDRAGDLSTLKDSMGQAVSTIKAADKAITQITNLVQQARAIANTAIADMSDAAITSRSSSSSQFTALLGQIDDMVSDASYAGKNLLLGDGSSVAITGTGAGSASNVVTDLTVVNDSASISVGGATSADTYNFSVTNGRYGQIDTNWATDVLTTLNAGTGPTEYGTFSNVVVTGSLEGTSSGYDLVITTAANGADTSSTVVNVTYNGANWSTTVADNVTKSVDVTLQGLNVSFDYTDSAGETDANTTALTTYTALGANTTYHVTDTRVSVTSTGDTLTGDAGTLVLSSYSDDSTRTSGFDVLDMADTSQSFSLAYSTGTVRFDLKNSANVTTVASDTGSIITTATTATNANDLTVYFNQTNTSSVTIDSVNTTSDNGLGIAVATNTWLNQSDIQEAIDDLDAALSTLRDTGQVLATNLSVVQTRETFTDEFINTLEEGADKWTLADSNAEGANMLMLQTRQQLGTVSLSIASQAAQSILRLFG